MSESLLSLVIFIPALAALILTVFLRGEEAAAQRNAKWVAFVSTTVTFLVSLFVIAEFEPGEVGFQFVEERAWLLGLQYKVGVDGISLLFVMLTTFLMPLLIAASWNVSERVKEYMIAFLFLETFLLGAFMALDLVLFYLFSEATLVPIFMILGIWGGADRVVAAFKLFLFTLGGSLIMLIAMVAMFADAGTSDIVALLSHAFASDGVTVFGIEIAGGAQMLLFLGVLLGFAVKLPIWPVHTWLPDAQAQAPAAGAVAIAALMGTLGGYGLLRFALPMFPVAVDLLSQPMLWLAAFGIVYTALVARVQEDMKRLIAYGTVLQMGFVTLGVFSANQQGIDGAIFHMVSHGLIAAGLFLAVGALQDRMRSSEIEAYGGLVTRMPGFAVMFLVFTLAHIGLPGTSGFVGLFLILIGVFQENTWVTLVAGVGLVLMASYGLWFYRKLVLGGLIKESLKSVSQLERREIWVLLPLIAMVLLLGVYPSLASDLIGPSVEALVSGYEAALDGSIETAAETVEGQ